MKRHGIDSAEIAVVGHALHSVAAEMGAALRRTAFSPNKGAARLFLGGFLCGRRFDRHGR